MTPLLLSGRFRNEHRREHWISFHDEQRFGLTVAAIRTFQYYEASVDPEQADRPLRLEISRSIKTRQGQIVGFHKLDTIQTAELGEKVAWILRDCAESGIPCVMEPEAKIRGQQ